MEGWDCLSPSIVRPSSDEECRLTWSEHPITKIQLEIDDYEASTRKEWRKKRFDVYRNRVSNVHLCKEYITKLFESGYITLDEYRYIRLIPYQGLIPNSVDEKSETEIHKFLFLCTERELYPLILRQITRYLMYLFIEAGYRRELLLDVIHFASKDKRRKIYGMAKRGCRLGDIINMFELQGVYQKYGRAEAYYNCLISRKVTQQI